MPETESSAGTPWRFALPGLLAVCVLAITSLGCAARVCWDCDVCASSVLGVECVAAQEQTAARDVTWFEGARLIDGNGGAPIEISAFLVENGVFAWVGRQGEREAPEGAARVDLSGKTVIPALIDAHQHIGLTNVKDGTHSKDNYTLANLVEHLERSAYHGVAATMSLGLEFDETLAFELRNERLPDAARFLTSGRGIAATPMAGPQQEYRSGIPRGAQTEAEGRAAVAELDGHGVDIIKIWVDDRGGTVPKLEPEVYRAVIDEAHARGMRVASHLGSTSGLADAKDLIRAGIDGFAHTVRDRDIDDEYMTLVRANPDVWTIPNLPGSPVTLDDLPWLGETLPPFEIENLRAQAERRGGGGTGRLLRAAVPQSGPQPRGRHGHRHGHRLGRQRRLDHAHRDPRHGRLRAHADGGARVGDADQRGDPGAGRPRHGDRGQERVVRRARREPVGRHRAARGGSTVSTCAASRWTGRRCGRSSWTACGDGSGRRCSSGSDVQRAGSGAHGPPGRRRSVAHRQ